MYRRNRWKRTMMRSRARLTGYRNQCPGCGELFNSTAAFDKHRTGPMHDRRCMSAEEMRAAGMEKNTAGFWITEPMPDVWGAVLEDETAEA
jgi:hypothetical protein